MGLVRKNKSNKNIGIAFSVNLAFTLVEIIGGVLTNSISIMSDAIHDLGDSLSIGVSWLLENKSRKKPDDDFTFGYARFSLLGGLINSIVLLVGSTIIILRAIPRIIDPQAVNETGMLFLALAGILVNGFAAYKTSKGKGMNEKVVSLHLLEDVLGWAAVLIASIMMMITGIKVIDPILSILITIYILFNIFRNLKKIISILLERAPDGISIDEISEKIINTTEVVDVHHVHLWSLEGINNFVTMHVVIPEDIKNTEINRIKQKIHDILLSSGIHHTTIEFEFANECCIDGDCKNVIIKEDKHDRHHH
ncbi:MAG: cation transporter [Clostridia bacterium]|nr:cation transporter [Clostridia bacterium]